MGPMGVAGAGGVVERIGGLTVTQAAMQNSGVSGVAMSNLNDPNKNLLNFNIQGTNGKFEIRIQANPSSTNLFSFCVFQPK